MIGLLITITTYETTMTTANNYHGMTYMPLERSTQEELSHYQFDDQVSRRLIDAIQVNDMKTVADIMSIMDNMEFKGLKGIMPFFSFDLSFEHDTIDKYYKYVACPVIHAFILDGNSEMFKFCVNKLRSCSVPLNEIFSIKMSRVILYRLLPDSMFLTNPQLHVSSSFEFIKTLIEVGFFTRSEEYHFDEVISEIRKIMSYPVCQNNLCNRANSDVMFKLIESVPELSDIYKTIPISQLPFRLDFVKTAYKHWLNVESEDICKKFYTYIPTYRVFDILPPANILAFLYSKGRDPNRDIFRLRVDFNYLLQTFKHKKHSDFKLYLRGATQYRDELKIHQGPNKFNLRYDEATIESINTMLDFSRMLGSAPNPEITKLSRGIMNQKYELEYTNFSNEESNVVDDVLADILPKSIVEMILSK